MLEGISFYDYIKVFSILAVLAVLALGAVGGIFNMSEPARRAKGGYKTKIVDLIFGVDIFLAAWFGTSFLFALIAGLGAIIILILLPPVIVLIAGISLCFEPIMKYKYIVIGILAAGLIPTFMFFDAVREWSLIFIGQLLRFHF